MSSGRYPGWTPKRGLLYVRGSCSAIGLSLDIAGAVVLLIGLFAPPRVQMTGLARSPEDYGRDAAHGWNPAACESTIRTAFVATLASAALVAVLGRRDSGSGSRGGVKVP